ncbi:aggregation-promoting factor C-terminal-like domain-containing protein [Streptomyces cavernicola]|uniref:Transglycosylase SLT domain-containing protein n=1 Tax=Streptomyces cavernicola TaxID=3043613 RepID=A0ABT6SF20_9ACTN|nr:transglycosylase SLT domain-containing protein [Streptomyces sp. B-S-A6]MDI3405896.1 transglycosylase SLT domain-containing protein [Streptomyces sp. B-S-A6]
MTVSALRRIATPKKTLAGAAVALTAAGLALSSTPAHAAAPAAAPAVVAPAAAGSPQEIAKKMIPDPAQYAAFSKIVSHESGWDATATNSSSGAYGLVQALPGSKMASAGSDWKTNPATQIEWGLDYMNDRYGSPVEAWNFWQANGWY